MTADGVLSSSEDRDAGSSPHAAPSHSERQPIAYCPYCSEETLFPREGGGWKCHSCLRAFSVTFLGLVNRDGSDQS